MRGAQLHAQWDLGCALLLQSGYLKGERLAGPVSPRALRCYSPPHPLYFLPPAKPFLYDCMPTSVSQLSTSALHGLELALNSHLLF